MALKIMKETILNTVESLVSDFVYYDRKEDELLSGDDLINSVHGGEISIDEIVEHFKKHLQFSLNP